MSEPSQRSLGLLRRILEGMQPDEVYTPGENRKFWKDTLFDAGFAQGVIDVASSYNFRWGEIIPDLYTGKFGEQNTHFSNALPPYLCERALRQLLEFAIRTMKDEPLTDELVESLCSDGFDLAGSGVDSSVPAELSRIPNKKSFISDLQRKLDDGSLVALLNMDLDGFKAVNDMLGHAKGDECLIRIARIVSESILGKGKLYRPGGDEFVVILPNFSSQEAASTAERIRAAIDRDNPGGTMKVTVSIGVATSESGDTSADNLADRADKAMYAAKKTKNSVAVADP